MSRFHTDEMTIEQYEAYCRDRQRQDFLNMAAPYYRQIADIRMMFGRPYVVVAPDGKLIEHGVRLDEEAQGWVDQIEAIIRYLHELSQQDPFQIQQRP